MFLIIIKYTTQNTTVNNNNTLCIAAVDIMNPLLGGLFIPDNLLDFLPTISY